MPHAKQVRKCRGSMDHVEKSQPAPALLYGTAWKEDDTRRLVALALKSGFRGIDTANQRKHYHEEGVGQGIADVLSTGKVVREDLFLQTKFTFVDGQDHRLPYDPNAPIAAQVRQSFESSLRHLGTAWIDSVVLHGPSRRSGLGPADLEAWSALEALVDEGRARAIGISNVAPEQLEELVAKARIRPAYVQNRCYAVRGWDADVRAVCEAHGIRYQGFSLLTANPRVVSSTAVRDVALRLGRTPEQVVLRLALQLGILPLTGTTDPVHMREDLQTTEFTLDERDMSAISG